MDLRKLAVNMIPFPALHFLMTSLAPLQTSQTGSYQNPDERTLIKQMFDKNYQMIACNPRDGQYLAATGVFRGRSLSMKALHELMASEKTHQRFVEWIPNNVRC